MAAPSIAKKPPAPNCPPAWLTTFADLMSLLLCFFILLLSFSEMDVKKFKQIAGSLQMAFGVQRQMEAMDIPMGTTVISQDFSPGEPTPTITDDIRQQTTDETRAALDKELQARITREHAEEISRELKAEIDAGLAEIRTNDREIMIRIREKGSFDSGSAELQASFLPMLDKIGEALGNTDGDLIVAGHTDDIPIATGQFSSNWVLSAARAANVVHYYSKTNPDLSKRMQIRAHADTRPIVPNDSPEHRAMNRRVEIVVVEGTDEPIMLGTPDDETIEVTN